MAVLEKIGFIGGGRMAEALIKGILQAGLTGADRIQVADPDEARRQLLREQDQVRAVERADEVLDCQLVVLAVKPQVMGEVLDGLAARLSASHLLVSIAAGIPLALIEGRVVGSGCRVVRVMPNTPALVLEGAAGISAGTLATADDVAVTKQIFDAIGKCVVLDERYLDAVTGLSGSGPAYVFTFLEAMIDGGVKVGLARPVAEGLALQTVLGSVKLAMESRLHPAELRAMVTSPGGTTIAGLHEMARAGFTGIMMDAIEAATERSRELGDQLLAAGSGQEKQ